MVTYKFIKRRYPSGREFWADFYRNNVCVGELRITSSETNIWFEDCPARLGGMAGDSLHAVSFKDFAKKVEATHAFDHFYDYWNGAYHYHFNPKTGYTACESDKFFPIVEEVTVTL